MAALQSGYVTENRNHLQKAFCFAIACFPFEQLAEKGNCFQKSSSDACLGSAACSTKPNEEITTAVDKLSNHRGAPKWL